MRILEILMMFFTTEVTIRESLQFSDEECISPRIENLTGSKWSIYRNLVNVNLFSCQVTKITRKSNCTNDRELEKNEVNYYDISRKCVQMATTNANHHEHSNNRSNCLLHRPGFWIEESTNITVNTHVSTVSFENDKVFIYPGISCNYSYGFCYVKSKAYVWKVHPPSPFSCDNLATYRRRDYVNIVKLSLNRDYLIFENDEKATAIELIEEKHLCGGKMWVGTKGYFATNDSHLTDRDTKCSSYTDNLVELPKKELYESLIENCKKSKVISDSLLYFYALVTLVVYAVLHLMVSIYNHFMNFVTLRRIGGGFCGGVFQSWINREFINMAKVTETTMEMDKELVVPRNTDRPSYYMYQARSEKTVV